MNKLEKLYKRYEEIELSFVNANAAGDQAGIEKAKADMRIHRDEVEKQGHGFMYVYYRFLDMKEAGNSFIDIYEPVDHEAELIRWLRDAGVTAFTYSSGWSSAVESAWLFQQNGCRLDGLVEINGRHTEWPSGKREKIHAYLFRIV